MLKSVKLVVVVLFSVIAFAFAHANNVNAAEVNFPTFSSSSNAKTLTKVSIEGKQKYFVKRVQKLAGTKEYLVILKNGHSFLTRHHLKKNTFITVQKYTIEVNRGSLKEHATYFKVNGKVVPEMTRKFAIY